MAAKTDHILHLGNPHPHRPIIDERPSLDEQGEPDGGTERFIAGHELLSEGPQLTTWKLQPDVADALIEHAADVIRAVDEKGAQLPVYIFTQERLADWEIAIKHVYAAALHHASAGFNWVSTEHSKLEQVFAALWGCEQAPKGTSSALLAARAIGEDNWDDILHGIDGPLAAKTEVGTAAINGNAFGSAAQVAAAEWMAVSPNNTAVESPSKQTTLAEEVTSAGGGLLRKKASIVETSKSVATITATFTANASDTLPVTLNKFGQFNKATSGGTMFIETKMTGATLGAIGDNVTISDVITTT